MEFLTIILLAATFALLIVLVGLKAIDKNHNPKKLFARRKVKFVPQENLFVAILKKIRLELKRHDDLQKHGNVFGHVLMGAPTIVVSDPELIELVLSKNFTSFVNRRVSFSYS